MAMVISQTLSMFLKGPSDSPATAAATTTAAIGTAATATAAATTTLANLLPSLSTISYLVGVPAALCAGYVVAHHYGNSIAADAAEAIDTAFDSGAAKTNPKKERSESDDDMAEARFMHETFQATSKHDIRAKTTTAVPVADSSEEVKSVGAEVAAVLAKNGLTELNNATQQVKEIGLNFAVIREYPKAMLLYGKSAVFSVGRTLINLAKSVLTFVDVRKVFNKSWLADNFTSTKKVANSFAATIASVPGAVGLPHLSGLLAKAQISFVSS